MTGANPFEATMQDKIKIAQLVKSLEATNKKRLEAVAEAQKASSAAGAAAKQMNDAKSELSMLNSKYSTLEKEKEKMEKEFSKKLSKLLEENSDRKVRESKAQAKASSLEKENQNLRHAILKLDPTSLRGNQEVDNMNLRKGKEGKSPAPQHQSGVAKGGGSSMEVRLLEQKLQGLELRLEKEVRGREDDLNIQDNKFLRLKQQLGESQIRCNQLQAENAGLQLELHNMREAVKELDPNALQGLTPATSHAVFTSAVKRKGRDHVTVLTGPVASQEATQPASVSQRLHNSEFRVKELEQKVDSLQHRLEAAQAKQSATEGEFEKERVRLHKELSHAKTKEGRASAEAAGLFKENENLKMALIKFDPESLMGKKSEMLLLRSASPTPTTYIDNNTSALVAREVRASPRNSPSPIPFDGSAPMFTLNPGGTYTSTAAKSPTVTRPKSSPHAGGAVRSTAKATPPSKMKVSPLVPAASKPLANAAAKKVTMRSPLEKPAEARKVEAKKPEPKKALASASSKASPAASGPLKPKPRPATSPAAPAPTGGKATAATAPPARPAANKPAGSQSVPAPKAAASGESKQAKPRPSVQGPPPLAPTDDAEPEEGGDGPSEVVETPKASAKPSFDGAATAGDDHGDAAPPRLPADSVSEPRPPSLKPAGSDAKGDAKGDFKAKANNQKWATQRYDVKYLVSSAFTRMCEDPVMEIGDTVKPRLESMFANPRNHKVLTRAFGGSDGNLNDAIVAGVTELCLNAALGRGSDKMVTVQDVETAFKAIRERTESQ